MHPTYGDFEGANPNKALDPMDPMAPDHFECDLPGVTRTRIVKGHKLVCQQPFMFWTCLGRVDAKPLHKSLQDGQFTSLEILEQTIDAALSDRNYEGVELPTAPSLFEESAPAPIERRAPKSDRVYRHVRPLGDGSPS